MRQIVWLFELPLKVITAKNILVKDGGSGSGRVRDSVGKQTMRKGDR